MKVRPYDEMPTKISKKRSLYHGLVDRIAMIALSNKIRIRLYKHLGMRIGKDTYIGSELRVIDSALSSFVTIGDRVGIAPRVTFVVSSGPSNSKLKEVYPKIYGPILIENDVWLGTGVIILPGVTVGEASIIGAGSVVTKDVPPFSVAFGVPAKVVKHIEIPEDV